MIHDGPTPTWSPYIDDVCRYFQGEGHQQNRKSAGRVLCCWGDFPVTYLHAHTSISSNTVARPGRSIPVY